MFAKIGAFKNLQFVIKNLTKTFYAWCFTSKRKYLTRHWPVVQTGSSLKLWLEILSLNTLSSNSLIALLKTRKGHLIAQLENLNSFCLFMGKRKKFWSIQLKKIRFGKTTYYSYFFHLIFFQLWSGKSFKWFRLFYHQVATPINWFLVGKAKGGLLLQNFWLIVLRYEKESCF